jgi:hypothetical protein
MRLKRSGFSLVLSLTIMAAMVMLVIVLAAFLQVESRLAQSHAGYLRARFNALASARIAIGQLQQLAGPDQRVTMRADMFADNDIAVGDNDATTIDPVRGRSDRANNHAPQSSKLHHQKRYLTGVWSTGGADSTKVRDWDVANPADSRLFLGWLASPFDENASTELSGTTPNFVPNRDYFRLDIDASGVSRNKINPDKLAEVRAYIDDILPNPIDADPAKVVPLVSFGSVNIPSTATGFRRNYHGAVDARPQPLPGPAFSDATKSLGVNGRYAFWIGDEGVKAKINLPDFYAATTGGAWLSTEDWDKGFAASANQRNSLGVLGGAGDPLKEGVNTKGALPAGFNFDAWRAKDIAGAAGKPQAYQLAKAVGTSGLSAWAVSQGGVAAGDAMNLAAKLLWHDITTLSYSTLTDTYNGGVKVDLSTAFELPYAMYRGIDLYPGQKDPAITTDARLRKQSLFHGAPNAAPTTLGLGISGMGVDLDYNRPNLVDKLGSASDLLKASPRASEWAPRYLSSLLGSSYDLVRARNGGTGSVPGSFSETPERLGFVYEAPLRSAFFESYTQNSNLVSRLLVNTERSPNALASNWQVTGPPNNANPLTERINALPWSELVENHPENLTGRIVRGPTWDLYRNYYRMYKREIEAAAAVSTALRGQGVPEAESSTKALGFIARGVEPLSYATGNRREPVQRARQVNSGAAPTPWAFATLPDQFYQPSGQLNANRYFYRNNLSAPSDTPSFQAEQRLRYPNILGHYYGTRLGSNNLNPEAYTSSTGKDGTQFGNLVTNFDRMGLAQPRPANNDAYFDNRELNTQTTTRTWPTSMSLTPSIVRFSMIFSGVFSNANTTDLNGTLGVTVDPVVMVHNPYDVAIEFEGLAMVTNGQSLPYIFDVQLQDWTFNDTHWQYFDPERTGSMDPRPRNLADPLWVGQTVQRDLLLGEIALGDGAYENRSFSFRLVNPGSKFRLEPGEVKTISTKHMGGDYLSNRASNTSIATNDFGYDLGSNAVYKMTPFYNARYRRGGDVTTQMEEGKPYVKGEAAKPDGRLWTWGFMPGRIGDGKLYVVPIADGGLGQAPAHGFFGGYCYNGTAGADNPSDLHNARDLWRDVKNSRRLRDAFGVDWDGTAKKLKDIMQFAAPVNSGKTVRLVVRNSGWVNYDNRVVGEEGTPNMPGYVFPRLRNGTTAVSGHQHWNFYLLNNRSIEGQALNKDRRWFGSPTSVNPTYNTSTKDVTKFASEGSGTAPGQHLVDESLLLNFQALTAGWPLYGNDNGHWSSIIQFDEQWMTGLRDVPLGRPRTPDYRIATGKNNASHTGVLWRGDTNVLGQQVAYGPENGDPELGRPEITAGHRAGSLNSRVVAPVYADRGDDKQPFFMTDFVLRSAEMTGQTRDNWYPINNSSANSNFRIDVDNNRRLETPPEVFNAPMSPFFLSVRPQQAHLFGYDGKAHTPIGWILSQRGLESEPQLALSSNNINAYWGGSVNPSLSQRSDTVLFPVPRRPLLSLAQLGSAGFAQVNTDADLTVGSSFAHPGIMDLTKVTDWPGPKRETGTDAAIPENGYVGIHEGTRIIRNVANVRTDHAFVANLALWDAYYFSGLNLQANSYSLPGEKNSFPMGPDLATDTDVAGKQVASLKLAVGNPSTFDPSSFLEIKAALEAGFNPLANKRVVFQPDNRPAVAIGTFPGATDFPHPAYLSRNALYDGGFNVNSTSKQAWKTVLAGMRGQTLPDGTSVSGTVLTRFARSFRPGGGDISAWNNYRELTDAEIDQLAAEVVKEVRARGPFMSLADFVNRRLLDSNVAELRQHGLKGALQSAIDRSGINNAAIRNAGGNLTDGTFNAPAAPTLASSFTDPIGGTGRGAPKFTNKNNDGVGVWAVLKKATNATAVRFPNLASMSQQVQTQQQPQTQGSDGAQRVTAGLGAPQIVTQMDVLNTVGPNLTARSDTFTVRAYGEALDNAGSTIGRAWIEVVVQRTTQLMLPSSRGPGYDEATRRKSAYRVNGAKEYDSLPMVDPYESLNANGLLKLPTNATPFEKENWHINRILGRRFKATSIRWLNANEI